jgi:hypothetical protein
MSIGDTYHIIDGQTGGLYEIVASHDTPEATRDALLEVLVDVIRDGKHITMEDGYLLLSDGRLRQVRRLESLDEPDEMLAFLRPLVEYWEARLPTPDPEPPEPTYAFPVGEDEYPPAHWYCAQFHTPGRHTGLDLNLDKRPWGDVERTLGLSVYAVADGVVHYLTDDWGGAPLVVIEHEIEDETLYLRYAHIIPVVREGVHVQAGDKLGAFADWKTGDHLHFDGATEPITTEWLDARIDWIDTELLLRQLHGPAAVDKLIKRGDHE